MNKLNDEKTNMVKSKNIHYIIFKYNADIEVKKIIKLYNEFSN